MDYYGSGSLSVDGLQIFLGDLDLHPERFIESDYMELLRLYDGNKDGKVTFTDFND